MPKFDGKFGERSNSSVQKGKVRRGAKQNGITIIIESREIHLKACFAIEEIHVFVDENEDFLKNLVFTANIDTIPQYAHVSARM